MTSRERVRATLNHEQPDKVSVDFCSANVTGINVSVMDDLRRKLGLPEKTVRDIVNAVETFRVTFKLHKVNF